MSESHTRAAFQCITTLCSNDTEYMMEELWIVEGGANGTMCRYVAKHDVWECVSGAVNAYSIYIPESRRPRPSVNTPAVIVSDVSWWHDRQSECHARTSYVHYCVKICLSEWIC